MMRPEYVGDWLCLFYVLLVVPASTLTSCRRGWFGPQCQYRCRCGNNSCDRNGVCTGALTCLGGWFGLACQYADIGFYCGDRAEITDGNDRTCITATREKTAFVSLNRSYTFTWLRVVVSMSDFANKIDVSFLSNMNATECSNMKKTVVDNKTVDIRCEVADAVEDIILTGDGIRYLCSVYVSGGRNVALKENTDQTSTYSEQSSATFQLNITFSASKAVDGATSQHLYDGFSCSVTEASDTKPQIWNVRFDRPRNVTRYVIYNRLDTSSDQRLYMFTLESYDAKGNLVYAYTNKVADGFEDVYTILHHPLAVSRVSIHSDAFSRQLSLCEVEIYGDSVCESGQYGLDCALACRCPDNSPCVVSTGECPSFVQSKPFNTSCGPGTYGPGCGKTCSQFCAKNALGVHQCQGPEGACLEGCVDGYMMPSCIEKCDKGMYGADCKKHCSQKCRLPREDLDSPCHHVSGVCVAGCQVGGSGPLCAHHREASKEMSNDHGSSYTGAIIGMCIVVLFLLSVMYFLQRRRPARRRPEERRRLYRVSAGDGRTTQV